MVHYIMSTVPANDLLYVGQAVKGLDVIPGIPSVDASFLTFCLAEESRRNEDR